VGRCPQARWRFHFFVRLDRHLPVSSKKVEGGWSPKTSEAESESPQPSGAAESGSVLTLTHDLHGLLLLHSALPFRTSSVWLACKTDSTAPAAVAAQLRLDVLVRPLSVAALDDPTASLARDPCGSVRTFARL
jgi:hypothetical protein